MKLSALVGGNRTGIDRAPQLAAAMLAGTREFHPSSDGDATGIVQVRTDYARSGGPVGTMPPPSGLKELAKSAMGTMLGSQPNLLMDKLGERLAFERSGTRLYDALIGKLDASGGFAGGPSRDDLVHLRDEELRHAAIVDAVMRRLGGDPTAVTPSANLHATASMGLVAVLTDSRTGLLECLEAILIAELADNDCWVVLTELARNARDDDAVVRFDQALAEERQHLEQVRTWLAAGQGRSVEAARALSAAELGAAELAQAVIARSSARAGGRSGARTSRGRAKPKQRPPAQTRAKRRTAKAGTASRTSHGKAKASRARPKARTKQKRSRS